MGTHLNYLAAQERVADLTRAAERARVAGSLRRGESGLRRDGLVAHVLAVARRSRPVRLPAVWVGTSSSTGRDTAAPAVAFDDHESC